MQSSKGAFITNFAQCMRKLSVACSWEWDYSTSCAAELTGLSSLQPWTYFTCETWASGISRRFPRFLETTQARQFSSTQYTVVSFPVERKSHFPRTMCKVCDERTFRTLRGAAEAYSWKAVIHFSRYAIVNSTKIRSSPWFSFVWLSYSGSKFFRVGPNILGKFVPGGTNFRGIQIECDTA